MGRKSKAKNGAAPPEQRKRGTPRRSKSTRWRAGVLVLVHVLFAIHIAHWMSTGRTMTPLEPSEAMEFAKHSVVNAGLVFFALTILSTLILGRWFCGWACHVVALQDLSRALLLKVGIRPRPMRSRWMMWMPLVAALYMFVWPLVFRLWIGDETIVEANVELTKEGFWDTFTSSWLTAAVTFFVAGFVAVYFLGAKGFCTYACPYGAFFGLADRVSPGRIRVTDACVGCGHCSLTCTSNVDVSTEVHDYGMVVDPGCMKCMDCVSVCPENALYFGLGKPAVFAKPRQEKRPAPPRTGWLEEVAGTCGFAFAYFAYRGFSQDRDFLLSLGLAACFGFLCALVVRLVRKDTVKIPGVTLKKGGKPRVAGLLIGGGTLALAACAVPYGIVPEVSVWRANRAWDDLEGARTRWLASGPEERIPGELSEDERRAAETLLKSAETIRERSLYRSVQNGERLVWGHWFAGDEEAYERALTDVLRFRRASPMVRTLAAERFIEKGLDARGRETYESLLRDYPAHARAAMTLAMMDAESGDREGALERIDRALAWQREDARMERAALRRTRGFVLADMNRMDDATKELRAALDLAPDDQVARDGLWRMKMQGGDGPGAASVLRDGLERDGAPEELRAHLAQVLLSMGNHDEALAEARTLARETQADPRMLRVAEVIFQRTGQPGEARKAGERAEALSR